MAEADTNQSTDRCQALTDDGERCSRPAQEDGFCYQHDESDPTVSDDQSDDESDQNDEADRNDEAEEARDEATDSSASAEMTDEDRVDPDAVDADDEAIEGVLEIRRTVASSATELIGREFDGVSEIVPTDDGWRAIVEVVERRSVPDTQDVIGRYEIELDENATVHGYRRLDRYRRGDTAAFE